MFQAWRGSLFSSLSSGLRCEYPKMSAQSPAQSWFLWMIFTQSVLSELTSVGGGCKVMLGHTQMPTDSSSGRVDSHASLVCNSHTQHACIPRPSDSAGLKLSSGKCSLEAHHFEKWSIVFKDLFGHARKPLPLVNLVALLLTEKLDKGWSQMHSWDRQSWIFPSVDWWLVTVDVK